MREFTALLGTVVIYVFSLLSISSDYAKREKEPEVQFSRDFNEMDMALDKLTIRLDSIICTNDENEMVNTTVNSSKP